MLGNPNKAATALVRSLSDKGILLVTAESLTGGLIGAAITSVPGASSVYWGGIVSYSVDAKKSLLGVPGETIDRFGVVSRETASAMAEGALMVGPARISVAVTGVAGPGGGTPAVPVGTVWIASAIRDASGSVSVASECLHASGSRDAVRRKTVKTAILLLAAQLDRL